jgi:hypothetical protein
MASKTISQAFAATFLIAGVQLLNPDGTPLASELKRPDWESGLANSPESDDCHSYSSEPAVAGPLFRSLKCIRLNDQGDWYASLGGQLRDRFEYFNHYQFMGSNPYNLVRLLVDADIHFGPSFRVLVQGISATKQGSAGGSLSAYVNELDLHQGFTEVKMPFNPESSFNVMVGRQNMAYGYQRLIGVSDWSNVRRTFDGLRARYATPDNTLDVFYVHPVQPEPYVFDLDVPGTQFAGIYDTWQLGDPLAKARTQLELYGLYVHRAEVTFNETTSGESRYTLGARLTSHPGPFDLDVEADYQLGSFNSAATNSFSLAVIGGYTVGNALFTPRLSLGFDLASGSQHDGNGDTIDQLFPSGHGKFGVIDIIGRQNIVDINPGIELDLLKSKRFAERVSLSIDYRQFWRQSNRDAVYTSSSSVLRAADGSNAYAIGGELDLELTWQFDKYTSAYMGYAHFFAGPFIAETGPDADIDFCYAAVTLTF